MFNFHKPRVYRSADGCCICRAKSSSSRFTASRKYEKESMQCFNLHEPRNGEICNACVLLVKRYKRLPVGSKRHWGHVVDARAGPGTKSLAKQKKRENEIEAKMGGGGGSSLTEKFAKILKKNRKVKTTATTIAAAVAPSNDNQTQLLAISPHSEEQPSDSNESYDDEHQQLQQQQQQQLQVHSMATTVAVAAPSLAFAATPYQTRKRTAAAALATTATIATTTGTTRTTTTAAAACNMNNSRQPRVRLTGSKRRRMLEPMKHRRAVDNVPFFEEHDLLRLDVCCGTVFQSLSLGSTCYIIDPELYKPCEKHRRRGRQQQQLQQQQQLLQQTEIELETKPAPSQVISTPALKKHHLFFKRQSESFPQGEIHRISPIPLHKTEAMPATTATITTATVHQQHQQQQHQQQQQQQPPPQHSTATNGGSLSLILKSGATAAGGGGGGGGATAAGTGLHANMLTTATAATTATTTTNNTTAVGAASPSSLSSSSNCSTSSSVATKFNDNSSDSGFDEHVLDRKSVSPPTQDELQLDNKKLRGGMQRLILASGLPISGQTQNLVLTGNEFTARFVQRQQQTPTQSLKITATATAAAAATTTTKTNGTTTIATGSQSSGNCNKMRAIFNNANTIQHENGVTTILPASSLAASNQTAAMNAIAPSTVTITPAKITINNNNINNPTNTIVANNPKFILLKPAIGKTPTEVKIA